MRVGPEIEKEGLDVPEFGSFGRFHRIRSVLLCATLVAGGVLVISAGR
jgi:hypothetical protein